jgi:hypothetical protein
MIKLLAVVFTLPVLIAVSLIFLLVLLASTVFAEKKEVKHQNYYANEDELSLCLIN